MEVSWIVLDQHKETLRCLACAFPHVAGQNYCGNCGEPLATNDTNIVHPSTDRSGQPKPEIEVLESPAGSLESEALAHFALASIEMMNYVQLATSLGNEQQAEQFRNDCISWIEERAILANGVVESIRNNVVFLSFPREFSTERSVLVAVEILREIQNRSFNLNGMPLKIRIGLDLESSAERNPMTSATERSLATPGSIVISEAVYRILEHDFTVRPIGPLKVAERMVTFYQLDKPYKTITPQEEILSDPQPRYPSAPEPTKTLLSEGGEEERTAIPRTHEPVSHPEPASKEILKASILQDPLVSEQHSVPLPKEPDVSPLPLYSSKDLLEKQPEPPIEAEEVVEKPFDVVLEPIAEAPLPSFGETLNETASIPDLSAPVSISGVSPGLMGSLGLDPTLLSGTMTEESGVSDQTIKAPQRVDESLRMDSGYIPPLYGTRRSPRKATHTYEETVTGIVTDLERFLENESSTGQIISLIGPDGIGKTYMTNNLVLKELIPDPSNPKFIWFAGHNYQKIGREQQIPLYFWYEMLSNFLSVMLEGVNKQDLRTHLSQMMNQIYQGNAHEETISFFCDLMSVNPLEPISGKTLERLGCIEDYLVDLLGQMSQHMPILMLIEDVDQADIASLDVLVRLLNNDLLKSRITLLLTYSDDFCPEDGLMWALESNLHKEYVVSPLNQEETIRWMAAGPFSGNENALSPTQMDTLAMYSHGNTNYLMEAISYLTVTQSLLVDPETGKLSANPEKDPNTLMLPATLQEMIQHRLRLLDEEQRYVLQVASVLGERFSLRILLDICEFKPEKLQQILEFLMVQQFITHDYTMAGQFRHRTVWAQVYETIEPNLRTDLHRLISEYVEELLNQNNSVNPGLVAYHAMNGGMANRAFQYWNLAGVYCAQIGSLAGLNMGLSKAMSLSEDIKTKDTIRARLQENLGVLNLGENPEFSIQMLEPAVAYFEAQKDTAKLVEGLGYLASGHEALGNLHAALELRDKVLAYVPKDQFPQEYVTLQVARLEYLYRLGRIQKAQELFDTEIEPLAHSHMTTDPFYHKVYLNARLTLAEITLLRCDDSVFQMIDDTLRQSEKLNLTGLTIMLKITRAKSFLFRGHYDSCQRSLESVRQDIKTLNNPDDMLARWGLVAMMRHCELGQWKEASALAVDSMVRAEKARDHLIWIFINAYAGQVALGENRYQDAQHILEIMATESSERRFATTAFVCWRFLTDVYMGQQQYEQALDVVSKALDIARKEEVNNQREIYLLTVKKAHVQLQLGQIKEAGLALQAEWPQAKQTGFMPITAPMAEAIGDLSYRIAQQTHTNEIKQLKYTERAQTFFEIARSQWQEMKNTAQAEKIMAKIEVM